MTQALYLIYSQKSSTSTIFKDFIANLAIDNGAQISLRYRQITSALNKKFRDGDSKTSNTLRVGSIGRGTAIRGVSDLDMLYIMPKGKWDEYKDGGQSKLLQDTKDTIKKRYPKTTIRVDRLVVTVTYSDFHMEVQPVFEQDDGSFKYPDTYNGGSWKTTKPRDEIEATKKIDIEKNRNFRRLCKMTRAWKNKHGVGMGGLLIDTLVYNFLNSTDEYNSKSYSSYDVISRDFFEYLKDQQKQDYYAALGSRQRVRVKKDFRKKAARAYELCIKAIDAKDEKSARKKWKKVYGRPFPKSQTESSSAVAFSGQGWRNVEEYIEDKFPVDIRYNITLVCDVSQDGFRTQKLSDFLRKRLRLQPNKGLKFWVLYSDIEGKYDLYWKILNRGKEAKRRNCIRGQIEKDEGNSVKFERTEFRGEHIAECYAVRDGVVIAKDRVDVPIQ